MRYLSATLLGVIAVAFGVYGVTMLAPLWAESRDNASGVYVGVGGTALVVALLAGVAAPRVARER
jgi:uncharacterized membrane protein